MIINGKRFVAVPEEINDSCIGCEAKSMRCYDIATACNREAIIYKEVSNEEDNDNFDDYINGSFIQLY